MARFKNGILGPFSGKIGDMVGYMLNGECIGRAKPRKKKGPPTPKEIANRAKFGFVQQWLQPLTPFFRIGFKNYNPKFQGFTAAKSYNSKNAVVGSYPDFQIDPALALVSYGPLDQSQTASVASEEPMSITVRWSGGNTGSLQKVMILLYEIEAGSVLMDTSATWRVNEIFKWVLKPQHSGRKYHVYIAFVDSDMTHQSTSQYLGAVTVA